MTFRKEPSMPEPNPLNDPLDYMLRLGALLERLTDGKPPPTRAKGRGRVTMSPVRLP